MSHRVILFRVFIPIMLIQWQVNRIVIAEASDRVCLSFLHHFLILTLFLTRNQEMNNLDEVNDNNNSDGVFDDGVRRKMLFGIASLNSEYIGKLTSQLQEYEQYRDDPLVSTLALHA